MNNVKAALLFLGATVASMAAIAILDRVSGNAISDAINSIRGDSSGVGGDVEPNVQTF